MGAGIQSLGFRVWGSEFGGQELSHAIHKTIDVDRGLRIDLDDGAEGEGFFILDHALG